MRKNVFLASILIVAFALLLSPVSARADDAADLLAKHKAFVGWSLGDATVQSLVLNREIRDEKGAPIQTAVENRIGLAFRRDYAYPKDGFGGATGFTGNLFWSTSWNGFTVPIIGDAAKRYLMSDALFMEGTSQLPATLRGHGTINGKSLPIVRVTMGGAFAMDLYIDPDTGAYAQAVIDPGGASEQTLRIHSYTTLDGTKKIIGSWSWDDDTSVYAYTKVSLNSAVAVSQLHPPAAQSAWSFADPKPFPIKVTQDRIYVNATVNGVQGRFILATGASSIVLLDDFARRANVKTIEVAGIDGKTKGLVRKADTVTIGGNTLSNVYVQTRNKDAQDSDYGVNHDGVIGFDLFGGAIVNLKLSDQTMSIGDPAATTVDVNSGYLVRPDLTSFQPRVTARIAGKVDVLAVLDTGTRNDITISMDVEKHGVRLLADREHTFLGGNRGTKYFGSGGSWLCGHLSGISVGPIAYGYINTCESSNWSLHDALFGFDFMKNFDYVFDYPHGQMIMTPHKN